MAVKYYEFQHPNMTNFLCPVCKTAADKPVILVGVAGTAQGGLITAKQIHSECFQLVARMQGTPIEVVAWTEPF